MLFDFLPFTNTGVAEICKSLAVIAPDKTSLFSAGSQAAIIMVAANIEYNNVLYIFFKLRFKIKHLNYSFQLTNNADASQPAFCFKTPFERSISDCGIGMKPFVAS